jgi:hypothetical protein
MEINRGDFVKIDFDKIKKYDNLPPYLRLVKQVINKAENKMPYVSEVTEDKIAVRSWKMDLIGDVFIPRSAVIKVKRGDD